MNITLSSKEYQDKQRNRNEALKGCDVCPFCGEKDSFLKYIKKGIMNKGISSGTCKSWYGRKNKPNCSIFSLLAPHKNSSWKIDCFYCHTCGTKW